MADKKYINKCAIKEKVFDNGGRLLNVAFNVAELSQHANAEGWVRIVIAPRRQPDEKGKTHYAYKDEWEPQPQPQPQQPQHPQQDPQPLAKAQPRYQEPEQQVVKDGMPF
jgi:hypothetical protein